MFCYKRNDEHNKSWRNYDTKALASGYYLVQTKWNILWIFCFRFTAYIDWLSKV